ncbi:MAG: heat-inducible transcription repressor HrcA [Clostridia bacterium]|nr:heat-inducible transcription repressor HrcA [Clostridia bacterium]
MEEFKSQRKKEILLYAVDEFIRNPQPITSASLSVHFSTISTATLRNELNALEQMGYLSQIHTSGGRVPTNLAYRYYVNDILSTKKLNVESLQKVKDNYENKSINLISTLSSLAKRLSKVTNCPTVLVQSGIENLAIVDIKIIPLIQKDALLLVETVAGIIDDNISLPADIDREACKDASDYLTEHFKGKTIKYMVDNMADVCMRVGAQMFEFKALIDSVTSALMNVVRTKLDITNENPSKMLAGITQNEYDETKDIFEFLEDEAEVINTISSNEFDFKIGDENSNNKLKGGMVMTAPIVIDGVNIASLAVVGPKRIDYSNLATALKFIVGQAENLNKKGE